MKMRWRRFSDFIITVILSIAYVIVTLLNVIGPLHINASGNINSLGLLSVYSFIFLIFSLLVTWGCYFYLQKKPEFLFFTLLILGILFIITQNFLWGWMGS